MFTLSVYYLSGIKAKKYPIKRNRAGGGSLKKILANFRIY